jgi:glycosyltransferase involved in cell wall biosynthesis
MDFSVIVPALNEETNIEACLKSISKQKLPRNRYEIIVSDGGSNDRTIEIARKYADRVIVSNKKGIWWGRNQGAKFAKGKYLVFIDADTRVKYEYLETVHEHLKLGIVGLTAAFEIEGLGFKMKMLEHIINSYLYLNSKISNVNLVGINLCVPRDVFMKVGGFKDFALEDAAIGRELRKEGRTCFLIQKMAVTSPRRLEALGVLGLCRYYFELGLIDGGSVSNTYLSKYMKYREYKPIRLDRQHDSYRSENFKELSKRIREVEKKVMKWTQRLT